MGALSDWSWIESPSGQHLDGQQRPEQDDAFESTQRSSQECNFVRTEPAASINVIDEKDQSVRDCCELRSYSSLHVRLTMMPHVINVLHQNCQRHQMTSVRIITTFQSSGTRSACSKFHENPHPSVKRLLMPEKTLELLGNENGVLWVVSVCLVGVGGVWHR